jgi:hypothetical protein
MQKKEKRRESCSSTHTNETTKQHEKVEGLYTHGIGSGMITFGIYN